MKASTLGLILIIIGTISGVLAYGWGWYYNDPAYLKLGLTSSIVQLIGLIIVLITGELSSMENGVH